MAQIPPPIPVFTASDGMIECGVDNTVIFNTQTPAKRIAEELFNYDFTSCMDKTSEELRSDFKTYSDLTVAQGQIRLTPGVKRNIQAYIQFVRDEIRMGRDPKNVQFDIGEIGTLLRRFNTHNKYIAKSKTLSEAAKPDPFKSITKWTDWVQAFLNYLKTIPGRDGVPLEYMCRTNLTQDPTPHLNFLEMYIKMAPLDGDAYLINKAEVHTLIVNFIVGNETAEAKIQTHSKSNDGREAS